ncbi:hypothetical protein [Prescottella equi]|uniref:hypothetical protein n=1 Tax=Rhodococcus hoagii TaxID=43767 RepID=UPI001A0219CD|nr:hypothetical protein [Prescottella equi]MBM4644242.1 hypothetical protein [Prescottella equi]MBM4657406.1 hypothetical protein [Prescottella equi]NKW04496.1 hypothetical protein [Prescottella equi]
MSITIRASLSVPVDCSLRVSDRELDIMVAHGVDVTDEFAVGDFYRANAGQSIDGWYFKSLADIAEDWETRYDAEVEVHDWSVEGEAPDRFWPAAGDAAVCHE